MNFKPSFLPRLGSLPRLVTALGLVSLLGACATKPVAPYDYTAFKASRRRG